MNNSFGSIGPPELIILVVLGAGFLLYFIPTILAIVRKKTNILPIALLNLLLGWSIVGWVIALVWAAATETIDAQPLTAPAGTKKCPFCAETIKSDAIVCRFCGRELSPPITSRTTETSATP